MGNQDQHAEYRLLKDSSEWHPALGGKRTPGSHNPRVPGRGAELAYFEAWFEDKMDGFNLIISTSNFIFSPQNVNEKNNGNEGHAHIYINGTKFRQYSDTNK